MFKKVTALIIAAVMMLSFITPDLAVRADGPAPVIKWVYLVTETDTEGEETLMFEIQGSNFNDPVVDINGAEIIPSYHSSSLVKVELAEGVPETIFWPGVKSIMVKNSDGQQSNNMDFQITVIPYVKTVNKSKVYVGESLTITGSGFDAPTAPIKSLIIGGTEYTVGAPGSGAQAIIERDDLITIDQVLRRSLPGVSSVWVIRDAGPGTSEQTREDAIKGGLISCITVVQKLTGIEVERMEPNTGPVTGGTIIRMYGKTGQRNFQDNMKVYIGGVPATDVSVITDDFGQPIGLQAKTPPSATAGPKDVVIKDAGETSEYFVEQEFTYLQTGNYLLLESIVPNQAKETETKEVTITGRNIGTINVEGVVVSGDPTGSYDEIRDEYVLKYNGTYYGDEVEITRKIKLTIGNIATITGVPVINVAGDVLTAKTQVTTMPQTVDVVMKTDTTVTRDGAELLQRVEEYIMPDAFTYIPAKTYPEISSITPGRGPCDEEIYITVRGSKFQVLTVVEEVDGEMRETTLFPVIQIGEKIINPNQPGSEHYMEIYDDEGNRLEGNKYKLGTLIKTKIPALPVVLPRFVDVTVTNPDQGSHTVENMFEFKKPDRLPGEMPEIARLEPNKGSVEGDETVTIYGRNFDSDADSIIVTIDGAAAYVKRVNSAGTEIEIVTPPGTEGYKTVQVINEDGSIATLENGYYYTRVKSSPEIEIIAPNQGGAGAQVIIKGKDFFPADLESDLVFNKLGTRVLLNGVDIDDYTIDEEGNIVFQPGGDRTKVIDQYTIKITIPPGLAVGPKDVTVVNPDTASYTVIAGFDYQYPASNPRIYDITGDGRAIDPDYGTVNGGTVVTIEGEDFRPDARVFFGGVEAVDVKVNGARTVIQATTSAYTINDPLKDKETVDVTVVNYDGGSATEENGFTYMIPYSRPVITSVKPDFGSSAGGEMVTITGRDFRDKDSEGDYRAPKIYFGGIEAQSVSMVNDSIIYAKTPPYPGEGRVDVTIVNADAGTHVLKGGFEYRRSRPKIDSVVPGKGSRNGNQEIVIHGSDFRESDLSSYYEGETVYKHVYGRDPTIDLFVVFGDEKDEEYIVGGRAEVTLGNIKTVYEYVYGEDNTKLYYISPEGAERLIATYDIAAGDQHLFIINGPEDLGDGNIVDEGILVGVSDNVLNVTRRVATHADIVDADPNSKAGTTIVVKTPPVSYTGDRNLYAINKDGSSAAAVFEYTNPDSNPLIFDIRPRREMYDSEGNLGGYVTIGSVDADTYITIDGADFRTGVRVFVEDIEAEVVSRSNEDDQLVVRVPPGRDDYVGRLLRIVVVNRDGGTADSSLLSIPRWFKYEKPGSGPVIDFVKPDRTSAAGGNELEIHGDDLRLDATVVIGGVPAINIRTDEWKYNRIYVDTPEGMLPGVHDLQVINPDYGTATLKGGITVISWPRINYVTNRNGAYIDSISFLGGDTIYIKGSGFMPGARVVFGGEIVPLAQAPNGGAIRGFNSKDQNVAVVGGKEAPSVEVVDGATIMLTTPEGVEGESTIVVINPDEGISEQFAIEYKPPIPDTPDDLDVSLVYDRYVRLEWPAVEDALYYEIYAREGTRGDFQFIASTTRTVYYIIDLDSDTRYYFRVKAVNRFGSSEFTSQRSIRTDDTREDDTDGGINEEQRITVKGDTVTVDIPEDALKKSYYYNIDLGGSSYAGKGKRSINIPLEVIRNGRGTFTVDTGGMLLRFSPSALNAAPLWSVSTGDRDRTYGRLTLDNAEREGERALKYLPARMRAVSGLHSIGLTAVVVKKEERCTAFNGTLYLNVKYRDSLPQGVAESSLALYRFDPSSLEWERVAAAGLDTTADYAYGSITKPGIYAVLGEVK